jgi:hypothetical protein
MTHLRVLDVARRCLLPFILVVLMCSCSTSSTAGAPTTTAARPLSPAPFGVSAVTWPADRRGVDQLLAHLPATVAGLPVISGSDAPADATWVGYGHGFITFTQPTATNTVATTVATGAFLPHSPPGEILMTLWGLGYGCKPSTFTGSLPIGSRQWFTDRHQLVWFECTVNTVEGAGTLNPQQFRYLAGWAGPERVAYLVDAPSPGVRTVMVSTLLKAASAS